MNRLVCPSCQRPSYCASLRGPLRCAYDDCGALILPGGELDPAVDRRDAPRINAETLITVEYLLEDRRVIEAGLPYVDASIVSVSIVLDHFPSLGSHVVVEFNNAGDEGVPWRVRGVVKEVQPAEGEGFRVGIEVAPEDADGFL